jgi:hypothetical protein
MQSVFGTFQANAFQVDVTSPIDIAIPRKKKRREPERNFEDESRKKQKLRKDLEYAVYGPPPELPEVIAHPASKIELPKPKPDYTDLVKAIMSHKVDDEEEAIQLLLGAF